MYVYTPIEVYTYVRMNPIVGAHDTVRVKIEYTPFIHNCADINDLMLGVKNDLGLQWPGYYSSNIANRHIAELYKYNMSLLV